MGKVRRPIYLEYEGIRTSINPEVDTPLFISMRNPSFLPDRLLTGVDLYIRRTQDYTFFYAVRWDLTQEQPYTYHILTRDQTLTLVQELQKEDYLGYSLNVSMKRMFSLYGLQNSNLALTDGH